MTDRELDAWISEHMMGWTYEKLGDFIFWKDQEGYWQHCNPRYTQDLNACREAEIKLTNTDIENKYWASLSRILLGTHAFKSNKELYKLFTATARQRCEAMWEVLEKITNP